MKLTDEQKKAIEKEYNEWKDKMYGDKTLQERQDFGQFFTPSELTIKMIEKFQSINEDDVVLDPTCGAGNLLAAVLAAGLTKNVQGIELDEEILKICQDRLSKFNVPLINLHRGNALYDECYEFSEDYDYDKACKAAEARIAKEELENSKKVALPKTGFGRFI